MNSFDLASYFQQSIGLNAQAWAEFVYENQAALRSLDFEQANLSKAAWQALQEPAAWQSGLDLLSALWPYIELSGKWLQWQELLEQALAVSRQAGQRDDEAYLLLKLGELARILGDFPTALARQQSALDLWRELGDPLGTGRALVTMSQVYLATGNQVAAESCCRDGIAILQDLDAPGELAVGFNNLGIICQEQGREDEAMAHYEQAAQLFQLTGNVRGQAKLANNLGRVYQSQAHLEQAAGCFQQAIVLYRQVGDDIHVARTQVNLGIVLYENGQVGEALALHQEVEPVFRRLGDRPWTARVVNNEGVFLQAMGRLAEAQAAFEQAGRIYREIGDVPRAAQSLTNCADLQLDFGRLAEARAYLSRVDELICSLSSPPRWVVEGHADQLARLEVLTRAKAM